LNDEPQWYPEAALAALSFMSMLFALAGVVNLLGIFEVELEFFNYSVTSRPGIVVWTTTTLFFTLFFGYLLRSRLRRKQ
jgi:hypothetical protein